MAYFRDAKYGLKDAGQFLTEGGSDVKMGCGLLITAGGLLTEGGRLLGPEYVLFQRAGQDIERGAKHARDNKQPIGQGWFMIANAGHLLLAARSSINVGKRDLKQAGELLFQAGHLILYGGDNLKMAGWYLRLTAKSMIAEAQFKGAGANTCQSMELIQKAGMAMKQAGEVIENGCRKILQTIEILNEHGPIVVKKGRLIRKANDIILTGRPDRAGGATSAHWSFVRLKATLTQKVKPLRKGLEYPAIVQQMPDGRTLREGPQKYDWLDLGLNDPCNLDEYENIRKLGEGGYGEVMLARRKNNHQERVAIKTVNIGRMSTKESCYTVQREKRAGIALKHDNIVNTLYRFNVGDLAYFIMEFCDNGDLASYIASDDGFTEEVARFYSGELICALRYMSRQGWVHRDVKPANILLDRKFHLKLTDFGLAKKVDDVSSCCIDSRGVPHMHEVATAAGTLLFMAPEQVRSRYVPTQIKSDIYTLGLNIYTMLTNKCPINFHGGDKQLMQLDILDGRIRRLQVGQRNVRTQEVVDLFNMLTVTDYTQRPGYDAIINHPWYQYYRAQLHADTMIDVTPPPFKQAAPSNNPRAGGWGPIVRPQLRLRGESFVLGAQQPPARASSGGSGPGPAPGIPRVTSDLCNIRVHAGGNLRDRHRNLGKNMALHRSPDEQLVDQTVHTQYQPDRPLARSATHILGRVGRPRTRSEVRSTDSITFTWDAQSGADPLTGSSASLSNVSSHIGPALRHLLQESDDEDDDFGYATGGHDILYTLDLASDPFDTDNDADVFSSKSSDMRGRSADRSQYILQNRGTFSSPGEAYSLHASQGAIPRTRPWHAPAPDSTPRRRPVFTIGGEVVGSRENIPEQYFSQSSSGSSSVYYTPQQSLGLTRTETPRGSLSNMTGQLPDVDQPDDIQTDSRPPPTATRDWVSGDAAATTPPPKRRESQQSGEDDGDDETPPVSGDAVHRCVCQVVFGTTQDDTQA